MREAAMPQVKTGASKPPTTEQKLTSLFQQIDTDGKGSITKAQFQQAFNKLNPPDAVKAMGAEAAFSKLDPTGSGSVSKQAFVKGMETIMAQAKTAPAAPVKAAPAPVQTASVPAAPTAPAAAPVSMPPQAANGPVGNTINVTA